MNKIKLSAERRSSISSFLLECNETEVFNARSAQAGVLLFYKAVRNLFLLASQELHFVAFVILKAYVSEV